MLKHSMVFLMLVAISVNAQEYRYPLHRDLQTFAGQFLNRDTSGFHTSVRPYLYSELKELLPADSVNASVVRGSKFHSTWVGRKLRKEHLLYVDKDDIILSVDPVFNFQLGREQEAGRNIFVNTRGALVQGNVNDRFYFYSGFHENQARYALYIDSVVRATDVVPGQGVVKYNPDEIFDFSQSYGGIAYTLNRHFSFLLAHDKNFIGDGYRSLLLSDNAYNYPFLRINMTFWKFRYTVYYNVMQELETPHHPDKGFRKKYSTIHYLDLNIGKKNKLTVGIFEAVLWAPSASRGYELSYLNPVLFLRPVENSLGSPDNALLGLNARWKINRTNTVYGQVMLDEFLIDEVRAGNGWWGNKQGVQFGYKSFNLFGVKSLNVQTEFNLVRPFTYQHRSPAQNYAHYSQALAHPLGANFTESISFVNYRFRNFFAEVKVQFAQAGSDTAGLNLGNNIFLNYDTRVSEYGHKLYSGRKNTLLSTELRVNYLVNPATNFIVEAGVGNRNISNELSENSTVYFYFGIRTALDNYYFDF